MLLLPRNLSPELTSEIEDLFLCPSIQEALGNVSRWLREKYGAEDVLALFERGFVGGKRCDISHYVETIRENPPKNWARSFYSLWRTEEIHTAVSDELRENVRSVIYSGENWPFPKVLLEGEGPEVSLYQVPRRFTLLIPICSELIVTQANERPFFGYFALFFDREPDFEGEKSVIVSQLPALLSAVFSGFIRELTSREEMLGFFALNVKQHLLLMDALMFHLDAEDRATREKLVTRMRNTSKRMLLETEKVLLADQEAAESFKIHPQSVSLNDLIGEVSAQLQPLFDTARVTIRPDLNPELPDVEVDPTLFPSVIYNLIENAFKYSRRGQKVYVRTKPGKDKETVILEVGDYGIGVPEDQKKVIFSKHYRASNVGEIPGNGLGLYLVKRIIDAHHGDVFVAKRPNARTTFVVEVPAKSGRTDASD